MSRRAGIIAGVIVILGVALWITVPRLARRMSFFQLHRIEVVGAHYLRESDVVSALHLAPDRSTLDPLDSAQHAAERIPGVAAASVERRLPGTLRVMILEELPVALSERGHELVLVDHRGRVLPFDPTRQNLVLPIADSGVAPAALLTRVMLADHYWYDEIDRATVEPEGDIVLRIGDHRIRLRPGADEETLRSVLAVRQYLSDQGIAWHEIDARYQGRVFVKKEKV